MRFEEGFATDADPETIGVGVGPLTGVDLEFVDLNDGQSPVASPRR